MDAECYSCHAPVAAGLEKPPPSGDRWLRPEDPNRRLPSRSHATVAAGVEKPPPSGDRWLRPVDPNRRLPSRCKAPVAARTLTFRMDRWRERSLKHQRCRPQECQRWEKGGLQLIEAPRKPQPNADSQTSPMPTATPNRC
jgi:hypothetical protein